MSAFEDFDDCQARIVSQDVRGNAMHIQAVGRRKGEHSLPVHLVKNLGTGDEDKALALHGFLSQRSDRFEVRWPKLVGGVYFIVVEAEDLEHLERKLWSLAEEMYMCGMLTMPNI